MSEDCLKLTTYFGERDRAGDTFLADALTEIYARHQLETSLILRGVAGFGAHQHVRTDRQLSLSEDLPITAVAVDARERIEAALAEVDRLAFNGLLTLERARMGTTGTEPPPEPGQTAKLTIYVGRQARVAGRPAYKALVERLHEAGIAGATVLLGVDGTAHGVRQRARFIARNADVPLMLISVGDAQRIAQLLPELEQLLPDPLVTVERVQVCRRDGHNLAGPPPEIADGWQKLMVYAGEQARHDGHPLYLELVRRLRAAGAAGATSLRGIWGYHGAHDPHGDTLWQLRRRVPVLTVIVDRPDRIRTLYEIVDDLTQSTGLVTCEWVPRAWPRSARSPA